MIKIIIFSNFWNLFRPKINKEVQIRHIYLLEAITSPKKSQKLKFSNAQISIIFTLNQLKDNKRILIQNSQTSTTEKHSDQKIIKKVNIYINFPPTLPHHIQSTRSQDERLKISNEKNK